MSASKISRTYEFDLITLDQHFRDGKAEIGAGQGLADDGQLELCGVAP
jgi:hypothetical protein